MKPVHILALVLAGALGGSVLMKVIHRGEPVTQAQELTPPIPVTAPAQPPAPAPVQPAPVQPTPVQTAPAAPPVEAAAPPADVPQPAAAPPAREVPAVRPPAPSHRETPRHSWARAKAPHRYSPPPANPRPLVVAKAERPPQIPSAAPPSPAPAPAQAQPALVVHENPTPPAAPAAPPVENVTPPPPQQPSPHTVTLNAGMLIPVRLVDGLSSERNQPGDNFLATIDHELVADGFVIAERGARVYGRVVAVDHGTKINGGASLEVELIRLHTSDRQVVPIQTDPFEKRMLAARREDVEKVGAGAAIGAVIGAIAGGGKGAAIGAGVGGGAGAGDVLLTRKAAALPSETRITFRLRSPVRLTERIGD